MKHRQIEAFRQVMLTGTTIGAADALSVTQPAISRLISDLEFELEFKLFERVRGRLEPTQEARRFMRSVERVYVGLDELDTAANLIRASEPDDLTICATPSISTFVLPRAIKSFRNEYPSVGLRIENVASSEIARSLKSLRADIGVSHAFPEVSGVVQETLVEASHVCAMPEDHRLSRLEVVTPADLEGENVIRILPVGMVNWEQTKQTLVKAGIRFDSNLGIQSSHTGYSLIAAGHAIALIEPFAAKIWENNGVVTRPFEPRLHYRYVVAYGENNQTPAPLSTLVSCIKATLNGGRLGFDHVSTSRDSL